MEEREVRNITDELMTLDEITRPSAFFPAWGPAVTVAAAMLIFLAASFYVRHRKVVKKRELLMDYFYIIFQYGGLRRKRMVAAICNTNAITLRELGRSFMISFDSIANSDNSCPFYLDDASYPPGVNYTPGTSKKTFFRSKGMISGKKARGPFRRYNTQSDDSPNLNPVSLQDILMRFKTKKAAVTSPTPGNRSKYRHGKLDGSSMCAIHGDELEYASYIEESEEPRYKRQRRNAYVAHTDSPGSRFADIVTEVGRHSLGNVMASNTTMRASPYPGKRNSEPWQNLEGEGCHCTEHAHECFQHPRVFQLNHESLAPSNVVCGSHGYIPKLSEAGSLGGSCCSYRNSEPTIVIHPASTDVDPTQGWTDIRNRYTNGIVFLKRVPKGDGTTGEFYYEEQSQPAVDLARRASLSKVSYVPSGNMNDYYNCLTSPKKTNAEPSIATTTVTKSPVRSQNLEPTKFKRNRLSLGEIAVSNFNRRIEILSESLHDSSVHDSSQESKGSQDSTANHQHSKYRSTWMKFKNVFSGSRSAHSSKSSKTTSLVEDRLRRRSRRHDSRWKRFFSVFTGYRSLPETKVTSHSLDCPKCSVSVPSGLDYHTKCHSIEIESGLGLLDFTMSRASPRDDETTTQSSQHTSSERPIPCRLPVHTRSVPEELSKLRYQYHQLKNTEDCKKHLEANALLRGHRRRLDPRQASSLSLPLSRKDFGSCNFKTGTIPSLDFKNTKRDSTICPESIPLISGRILQQSGTVGNGSLDRMFFNRRFRNLSPLPETCIGGSKSDGTCANAEGDNISESSIYLTPSHFRKEKNVHRELIFNFDFLDNVGVKSQSCHRSHESLFTKGTPLTKVANVRKVSSEMCLTRVLDKESSEMPDIRLKMSSISVNSNGQSQCNFYSSVNIAQSELMSPLSGSSHFGQPNSFLSDTLSVGRRQIGVSSETVYYDTTSAVGTPCANSPTESKKAFGDDFATLVSISPESKVTTDTCMYYESSNIANSIDNVSFCSELMSSSPNPSQLSSPLISRTPSPCRFWQTSPQYFIASEGQLAIPTPTRSAFSCSSGVAHSQTDANPFSILTTSTSTPNEILLPSRVLIENQPGDLKDFGQLINKRIEMDSEYRRPISSTNTLSLLDIKALEGTGEDQQQIGHPSHDSWPSEAQRLANLVSGEVEGDWCEAEHIHDVVPSPSQASPGSSRHPTPTRSFSTPSPTLEKPNSHQSASLDEIYRANVSRLPRFARRASQGQAIPYLQNTDFTTARTAGERNGPLRESSTELKEPYASTASIHGNS